MPEPGRLIDAAELEVWLRELPRWRRLLASPAMAGTRLWRKVDFLDRWVGYLQTDSGHLFTHGGDPPTLSKILALTVHHRYLGALSPEDCAERLGVKVTAVQRYCEAALELMLGALRADTLDIGPPYEECRPELMPQPVRENSELAEIETLEREAQACDRRVRTDPDNISFWQKKSAVYRARADTLRNQSSTGPPRGGRT